MTFTILSLPNQYWRVIVGDNNGNVFTSGYREFQKLLDEKLIEPPLSGGDFRSFKLGSSKLRVRIKRRARVMTVQVWSEPMLGLETVCAFDRVRKKWLFWAVNPLDLNGL